MASMEEFKALSDSILPYLTNPPNFASPEQQHAYLAASLEFAYTAVELVEAQLERNLRAAQEGLADAHTEQEILEMERMLIEEQTKMDNMKAVCRADTKKVMVIANCVSHGNVPPNNPKLSSCHHDNDKLPQRGKITRKLSKLRIWP